MEIIYQVRVKVPDLEKRIKQARRQSRQTVQALATKAGISLAYWYRIEGGQSISPGMLKKIEDALGVEFDVKFDIAIAPRSNHDQD